MKYQARAYYQQNISSPHGYGEQSFNSQKAGLAWAKSAYEWVFLVEIWQGKKLVVQQSRWYGKNWKHTKRLNER